jgi:hypothetical protein
MIKKQFTLFFAILSLLTACRYFPFQTLSSTTTIKAKDAFILGNNEHGKFSVRLKNTSHAEITIWQVPISGGQHSPLRVGAIQQAYIKVDRNTALRIENPSTTEIDIELLVKGDTGLSMGYKN